MASLRCVFGKTPISFFSICPSVKFHSCPVLCIKQKVPKLEDEGEFKVLVIPGYTKAPELKREDRRQKAEIPPPRFKSMPTDQDWTDVWPTAHTFRWSVVPFPVRQGFIERTENDGVMPSKYANAELMKIPNFLHLTPGHIKKHCAALKKFCNPWPKGLETNEACDKHFPVEVVTRDYVADSSSIRDPRARIVTITLKLSDLELDYHARDKFIRLAGSHYDKKTDILTLESDRCPLKQQNYDYTMYLLTALYKESWKTESWESSKTLSDMEKYFWKINKSCDTALEIIKRIKQKSKDSPVHNIGLVPSPIEVLPAEPTNDDILKLSEVEEYGKAVEDLHNKEESVETLDAYKLRVKKLFLQTKKISESTVA